MPGQRVEDFNDRFADLDARIAEILFRIRRGEAEDVTVMLPELEELRDEQTELARLMEASTVALHPELLIG